MKLKTLIISLLSIIGLCGIILLKKYSNTSNNIYIGIIQTASHPALDDACDGFIETLKNKLGSVNFIIQNAQGSIPNAHSIAQRLHRNEKISIIYAIATPAAQAISAIEKEKPILIAAVTDTTSLENQKNISGVNDMPDMNAQIQMILKLIKKVKSVAILYNPAESNSIIQIEALREACKKYSLELIEIGINQESDISTATEMACRKADAIICPLDNMTACAMNLIAKIALKNNKPLFACHNEAVQQGALAARGVNYYNCGKQAAEIAYKIIVEKNSNLQKIEKAYISSIYVNQDTLNKLNLTISDEIKKEIVFKI